MELKTSQKVILISENKRLFLMLRGMFGKHNIEIENGYLNLHSLPMIRKVIAKTGSTAFIRTELMRFLREVGMPYMIVLDDEINLGSNEAPDTDKKRLLRTYLVAYIILSRGQGLEKLAGNIILAAPGSRMDYVSGLEKNPLNILNILTTKDPTVNTFIEELKRDEAQFRRLFYIRGLNTDGEAGEIFSSMDGYLSEINRRILNP